VQEIWVTAPVLVESPTAQFDERSKDLCEVYTNYNRACRTGEKTISIDEWQEWSLERKSPRPTDASGKRGVEVYVRHGTRRWCRCVTQGQVVKAAVGDTRTLGRLPQTMPQHLVRLTPMLSNGALVMDCLNVHRNRNRWFGLSRNTVGLEIDHKSRGIGHPHSRCKLAPNSASHRVLFHFTPSIALAESDRDLVIILFISYLDRQFHPTKKAQLKSASSGIHWLL